MVPYAQTIVNRVVEKPKFTLFVKSWCIIFDMSPRNPFEGANRSGIDLAAIKQSMAERDPEDVGFAHKHGGLSEEEYFEKQEARSGRRKKTDLEESGEKKVDLENEKRVRSIIENTNLAKEEKIKKLKQIDDEYKDGYLFLKKTLDLFNSKVSPDKKIDYSEIESGIISSFKKEMHKENLKYIKGVDSEKKEESLLGADKLKSLGFSQNEINNVYSQDELSEILEKGYKRDEWLKIYRERNVPGAVASNIENGPSSASSDVKENTKGKKSTRVSFVELLEVDGGEAEIEKREENFSLVEKIASLTNLGWTVKEAKGMSRPKTEFVLKNKIRKEDWENWQEEYNKQTLTSSESSKTEESVANVKENEINIKNILEKDPNLKEGVILNLAERILNGEDPKKGFNENENLVLVKYQNEIRNKINELKEKRSSPAGYDKFNFRDRTRGEASVEKKISELEAELELLRKVRGKLLNPQSPLYKDVDDSYLEGQTLESIDEKIESRKNDIKYLNSDSVEVKSSFAEKPESLSAHEVADTPLGLKQEKPQKNILRENIIVEAPPGTTVTITETERVLPDAESAEKIREMGPQAGDDIDTKISKLEKVLANFSGVSGAKSKLVIFEFTKKLEKLKSEKEKIDKVKSEYEKNEKELLALGWTFEDYLKESEFNRSFIVFNKIEKEKFSSDKEEKPLNSVVGQSEEIISDQVFNKFTDEGTVPREVIIEIARVIKERDRSLTERELAIQSAFGGEVEEVLAESLKENDTPENTEQKTENPAAPENTTPDTQKEELTPESFADHVIRNTKDGVLDKGAITQEQLDFYKKNKAEIKRLIEEKTGQFKTRAVSPGAQEFVSGERVKVEDTASLLERGYENLNKEELIKIAREKGLSSSGEKQAIIERIANFDAKNGTKDFGWVKDPQIKEKLREFNLSEKDMILMSPEFFDLPSEKQRYLFSKLEQKIYLDAEFAARDKNEEEIKKLGWFKKIGASFSKDQRKVKLRDQIIGEIKAGGVLDYKDDVSVLGQYLKDAPDLRYIPNEKGRLVPVFEFVDTKSVNKKFETPKAFFNMAASKFSEIPYEWSLDSANSSQKDAYRRARESYVSAKDALVRAMGEEAAVLNQGMSEEEVLSKKQEAMAKVLEFDAKINFGRYITQNPEMEKLTSNFTERVLGTNVSEFVRGKMFFAAGYLTRTASKAAAVTGMGILASAAVGGYMGYRKKNLEFNQKELRKRYGSEVKELGVKNVVNSSNVYGRLEKLVSQFEKTKDEKSRARILETIKTRIFVTEEMMSEGRINFGNKKEQVFNQYKLSGLMSEASVLVAMNGGFNEEKTQEEEVFGRFKSFVEDSQIQGEKDAAITKAALRGAAVGVVGFGVGSSIRYLQETGQLQEAMEYVSEKTKGVLDWTKTSAEEVVEAVKDKIYAPKPSPTETIELTRPEDVLSDRDALAAFTPASVEVGSRGAIGAIDDLQKAVLEKLGDNNVPEKYREFLSKDPHDLAREWGFYKPGEEAESAVILKGAKIKMSGTGVVLFEDHKGNHTTLYVPNTESKDVLDTAIREDWASAKKFEGEFFDYGKSGDASYENIASVENAKIPSTNTEIPKEEGFDFEKYKKEKVASGWEHSGKSGDKFTYKVGENENLPSGREGAPSSSVTVNTISSGNEFVPTKPGVEVKAPTQVLDNVKINGKDFQFNFEKGADGKPYVPMNTVINWDLGLDNVSRREFLTSALNKEILQTNASNYRFGLDFDRLIIAEKMISSGELKPNEDAYKALQNFIAEEKSRLSSKYGEGLFSQVKPESAVDAVSAINKESPDMAKVGNYEFFSGRDPVNTDSKILTELAKVYGDPKVDKGVVLFGDKYVGFYDESTSQSLAAKEISNIARKNGLIGEVKRVATMVDGKYRMMIVYKINK
jgi:hypothetical protein